VALTNVVARALPLNCANELLMKLVPVSVSVNAAPPAPVNAGEIEVSVGGGLLAALILKFTEFDVPPPGVGFVTVIAGARALVTSVAKIAAVNCVALTNVVVLGLPAKFTTDVFKKFVPVTVKVRAPLPAVTPVGESEVMVGAGFVPPVMLKFVELEVPPPGTGFVTVICAVPIVITSGAKIAAVNCVALTNVVALGAPLKFTTEVFTKFEPFTVNVNALEPATTEDGCSEVIAGTGLKP
jgi:hypothetical protein